MLCLLSMDFGLLHISFTDTLNYRPTWHIKRSVSSHETA